MSKDLTCRHCEELIDEATPAWMRNRGFCDSVCEAAYKTPLARVRRCGCDESRDAKGRLAIAEGAIRGIERFCSSWASDVDAAELALDLVLKSARTALEELRK